MEIGSALFRKNIREMSGTGVLPRTKKIILYSLVICSISWLTTVLFFGIIKNNLAEVIVKTMYITAIISIGIFHTVYFPGFRKRVGKAEQVKFVSFNLVLSVFIFSGNYLFHTFSNNTMPDTSLPAAAGFLLPAMIFYSLEYLKKLIPEQEYTPWHLPASLPGQTVSLFLNSLQIGLKIKTKTSDAAEESYVLTVPGRISLGEMFHRFIISKESGAHPIQIFDKTQKPFIWKFTLKKVIGIYRLDPASTLIQNKIAENDIIIVERMS